MNTPQVDPSVRVTLTLSPMEAIVVTNALSMTSAIAASDEAGAQKIALLLLSQADALGASGMNALVHKASDAAREAVPQAPVIPLGDGWPDTPDPDVPDREVA